MTAEAQDTNSCTPRSDEPSLREGATRMCISKGQRIVDLCTHQLFNFVNNVLSPIPGMLVFIEAGQLPPLPSQLVTINYRTICAPSSPSYKLEMMSIPLQKSLPSPLGISQKQPFNMWRDTEASRQECSKKRFPCTDQLLSHSFLVPKKMGHADYW